MKALKPDPFADPAGNRLRICYGLDGTLPGGFKTTPDSQLYLATYRRKSG
jgi:hypothetical protein